LVCFAEIVQPTIHGRSPVTHGCLSYRQGTKCPKRFPCGCCGCKVHSGSHRYPVCAAL
jgi:hypothetical protein